MSMLTKGFADSQAATEQRMSASEARMAEALSAVAAAVGQLQSATAAAAQTASQAQAQVTAAAAAGLTTSAPATDHPANPGPECAHGNPLFGLPLPAVGATAPFGGHRKSTGLARRRFIPGRQQQQQEGQQRRKEQQQLGAQGHAPGTGPGL